MGLEYASVRTFFGVPKGFQDAALAESGRLIAEMNPHGPNCAKVENGTRNRWKEKTGLEPQDSRFTVIVPIHNEERFLPAALGAIARSDIPSSAHVNFVFVTNNCTDSSSQIVDQFMNTFGKVGKNTFLPGDINELKDLGLDAEYSSTTYGNMTFTRLNTSTASKANALNLGNYLAVQKGDKIAVSVDANNFVEPDAVASLFGTAYESIIRNPDGTAVLCADDIHEMVNPQTRRLKEHIRKYSKVKQTDSQVIVSGWMMAWDTEFVKKSGGVPHTATEDYALGVLARVNNRKITRDINARIWGYESASLRDHYSQMARFARGKFQLIAQGGEVGEIVRTDDPYFMGDISDRLRTIGNRIKLNPIRAPYLGVKFVVWEATLAKARRDFEKDPRYSSWEPIASTKGYRKKSNRKK